MIAFGAGAWDHAADYAAPEVPWAHGAAAVFAGVEEIAAAVRGEAVPSL